MATISCWPFARRVLAGWLLLGSALAQAEGDLPGRIGRLLPL
jgi:hypothetical protein